MTARATPPPEGMCRECAVGLPSRNRTGLCSRCYARERKRRKESYRNHYKPRDRSETILPCPLRTVRIPLLEERAKQGLSLFEGPLPEVDLR
jgi:hypothetical protein